MIWTPVRDSLLDLRGREILSHRSARKRRELAIGGESKSNQLRLGKGMRAPNFRRRQKSREPEPLFQPDNAILSLEGREASNAGENDKIHHRNSARFCGQWWIVW